MMITAIIDVLHKANRRGGRAVVLVPEAIYELGLKALGCVYEENFGRSARQRDNTLVTVVVPSTSTTEVTEPFTLYLAEWGKSTRDDERGALVWMSKATNVVTEVVGYKYG